VEFRILSALAGFARFENSNGDHLNFRRSLALGCAMELAALRSGELLTRPHDSSTKEYLRADASRGAAHTRAQKGF
jgi:hypothetical protein